MSERCHHCEYADAIQVYAGHAIPMRIDADVPLPGGWQRHPTEPELYVRPCVEHGGRPNLPEGKTLKAYLEYAPGASCTSCGDRLNVRVFDGKPPQGHDDNIRYQEIIIMAVAKCQRCAVLIASPKILS